MNHTIPVEITAHNCSEKERLYAKGYLLVLFLSEGAVFQGTPDEPIPEGAVVFLSPFSDRKLIMHRGTQAISASIPTEFVEVTMGTPKRDVGVISRDASVQIREKLIDLFDMTYNEHAGVLKRNCVIYELLTALEEAVASTAGPRDLPVRTDGRAAQMAAYLEAHFREPITLGDLADAFSVSRQYTSTTFHRELGVPFSEYLLRIRLRESLRLLLTTDQNVTTISENSGFPNLRSFNLAFRAEYGIGPREFRRTKAESEQNTVREPSGTLLQSINQLLRPYRLVYQKNDSPIHFSDELEVGTGKPLNPKWDILNVDNPYDCLQQNVQTILTKIQQDMHFRYVRLSNISTTEMIPFHPAINKFRFTHFIRLINFFRGIGLTPMLSFGDNYEIMIDALSAGEYSYSVSIPEWLRFLEELLDTAVHYWETDWVSQWRFEFYFPKTMYNLDAQGLFMDLFEQSAALIRRKLPAACIGGPALSAQPEHKARWDTWFTVIRERSIPVDFISMEVWADHEQKIRRFQGRYNETQELRSVGMLRCADASLAVQNVRDTKSAMKEYGLADIPLYVSALGITKYQATAAQIGGHCASYLIRCNLELNNLVQGIGCWKALNHEAEYIDEFHVIGFGCGMTTRFGLRNINWYAHSFLSGLMPSLLFQNNNYMITTDGSNNYAILIHNNKNYSAYFCQQYHTKQAWDFTDPKLYVSDAALEQTITISGVQDGSYRVKQYLIGNHHGCVAAVLRDVGYFEYPSDNEVEYLAGQSLPYQHAFLLQADGKLRFTVSLQANEAMLLQIRFEGPSNEVIPSRKGFEASNGGIVSPILEDGTMV